MKKITILFLATFALFANNTNAQQAENLKAAGLVFTENGEGQSYYQQLYRRGDNQNTENS